MGKRVLGFVIAVAMMLATACSSASPTPAETFADTEALVAAEQKIESLSQALAEKEQADDSMSNKISELEKAKKSLEAQISTKEEEKLKLSEEIGSLKVDLAKERADFKIYKDKMKPFEELDAAEAEARRIEADKVIAEQKAAEAQAAADAAAAAEAEEKKGYNTGVTFSQLARNPEEHISRKFTFTGTVVQLLEGDGEITLRFAIDDDYDQIILVSYFPSIVNQRVLEDDELTIYGFSIGTHTYESTMGQSITVPAGIVDKIEFR